MKKILIVLGSIVAGLLLFWLLTDSKKAERETEQETENDE